MVNQLDITITNVAEEGFSMFPRPNHCTIHIDNMLKNYTQLQLEQTHNDEISS